MLDGDNTTCFGFENRDNSEDQVMFMIPMTLYVKESVFNVRVENAASCTEFQQGIIVSTLQRTTPCVSHNKCQPVSHNMQNNTCVLQCTCPAWLCKIRMLFLPGSNVKICEMGVEVNP